MAMLCTRYIRNLLTGKVARPTKCHVAKRGLHGTAVGSGPTCLALSLPKNSPTPLSNFFHWPSFPTKSQRRTCTIFLIRFSFDNCNESSLHYHAEVDPSRGTSSLDGINTDLVPCSGLLLTYYKACFLL